MRANGYRPFDSIISYDDLKKFSPYDALSYWHDNFEIE